MGTVDLLSMIAQAQAIGLTLNVQGDVLQITGPKTPDAAAIVQQLAPHKAAVIALLQAPPPATTTDDLLTADLYADLWHRWLTWDELNTVADRSPELTFEVCQLGDRYKLTAAFPVDAELWTSPKGRRHVA